MNRFKHSLLLIVIFLVTSSCSAPQTESTKSIKATATVLSAKLVTLQSSCTPTLDDGVSPSYQPGAPERTVVGKGHVVTGVVLSSVDCQPIAHAKLEFWPEEAGLGHPDSSRATFFTDQQGRYRFECNPPEHIHMRISAPGYRTIGVNSYHPNSTAEGVFEIVLTPES